MPRIISGEMTDIRSGYLNFSGVNFSFNKENIWHGKFFKNGGKLIEPYPYSVRLEDGTVGNILVLSSKRTEAGNIEGEFTKWAW